MKTLGEHLKDIRKIHMKTLKELSNETGINRTSLTHYELNKQTPTLNNAIKLANYYKVSLDYLCNRRNCEEEYNEKSINCIICDYKEECKNGY